MQLRPAVRLVRLAVRTAARQARCLTSTAPLTSAVTSARHPPGGQSAGENTPVDIAPESVQELLQAEAELSLSELLERRGVSVQQALQLDPAQAGRVIVKGKVTYFKRRDLNTVVTIHDGLSPDQLYLHMPSKLFDQFKNELAVGCSLVADGLLFANAKHECNSLYADRLLYLNSFPRQIVKKELGSVLDWSRSREQLHLRSQSRKPAAVARVRSQLIQSIHELMLEQNFYHAQPPALTSFPLNADCSFLVEPAQKEKYFQKPVYLAGAGELHLETLVTGLPQVYSLGPAFRPVERRSRSLAAEFQLFELAATGPAAQELPQVLDSVQTLCRTLAERLGAQCANELELILDGLPNRYLDRLLRPTQEFFRLTYDDAVAILNEKRPQIQSGEPLDVHHRQALSDYFEQYPIFVTHFPRSLKGFNVQTAGDRKLAFDLIFPTGLRVASGALKELDVDVLRTNLETQGRADALHQLDWYFESKRLGNCPSYGVKLSLDQFLMVLCNLPSIRDAIPFPRLPSFCPM